MYVPGANPIPFPEQLDEIRAALPAGVQVYLVGGAVRDALLGRETHDLDFVMPSGALEAGRRVANALGAAYYPLDEERETARVVRMTRDGSRVWLDFSIQRGDDLESDLRSRDFTINAIAVDVHQPQTLLDPLGGAGDLRAGLLRTCSPLSFLNDPVRILRGVRQAAAFGFRIHPETLKLMRAAVGELSKTSVERLRDELFRILDGAQPATAMRALEMLGVLPYLLPELPALKGVTQSPPHIADVWSHTLDVTGKLAALLEVLGPQHDPDAAGNLTMGLASVRLGRYRQQIEEHLNTPLNPDRSLRGLLLLAALYHDSAKPQTRQVEDDGRVRFFDHDEIGARLVHQRALALHLSNDEADRLQQIVRHHMRPLSLAQNPEQPTRRAVFRFFRDTRAAGVDVCLHSMADTLATYGPDLPQDVWARQLDVVRSLLEAWWEYPDQSVAPPALLGGRDVMEELGLSPGPEIGRLLELVLEAQAAGQVQTREEALDYIRTQHESRPG
jgi:poly(A) polymerase